MTGAAPRDVMKMKVNRKSVWMRLIDQRYLMLMSIPMLLYVLLFNYYPLWGWRYAFQNLDLTTIKKGADWIGLGNFEWLFKEKLLVFPSTSTATSTLTSIAS